MIKYVLNYYNLNDDGGICYEHRNPELVVEEAIRRCSEDGGRFTYRMETWDDKQMIGEMRFFQNGTEFTELIINSITR